MNNSRAKVNQLALHPLFGDNMVLQYGQRVNVWGQGREGETVTVAIAGQEKTTQVQDGAWRVQLDPMQPGGPHILRVAGERTIELSDVWVGDVWLFSGQSNIYQPLRVFKQALARFFSYSNPDIKLASIPPMISDTPLKSLRDYPIPGARQLENRMHIYNRWMDCIPENTREFSAVGFCFAHYLQEALDMPVGVVQAALGNTKIEHWLPRHVLPADTPPIEPVTHPVRFEGEEENSLLPFRKPTLCYNGMIAPLQPFTFRGVAWYQGESNSDDPEGYDVLLKTLISTWRDAWDMEGLPFLIVQLAGWGEIKPGWSGDSQARLKEAQAQSLSLPNVGLITGVDVGDENIHFGRKDFLGYRLARLAQRRVHGRDVPASGPWFSGYRLEGNRMILSFQHTGSGLMAGAPEPTGIGVSEVQELDGFGICGPDGEFVEAQTAIEGHTVVVWHPQIPEPVTVRYAYSNRPRANLYNREGFPAFPFRTDRPLDRDPARLGLDNV